MSSPTALAENASGSKTIKYMDTTTAYELWSEVYDQDGNFLQALDTIEMQFLLPEFLSSISSPRPLTVVDLGCGTGRNTARLLEVPGATIVGLDASPKMLEIAASKLQGLSKAAGGAKIFELAVHDLLDRQPPPAIALEADALISTLVLEHIQLPEFFHVISQILKPGGVALVTNMHSEMGAISQAGFVDPKTGEKVRPTSYAHRLEDVIAEAKKQGFEVSGEALERTVDEKMSEVLGARAWKWIGVTVWFGICFRKGSTADRY